jgi:hypothetical protein
MAQAEQEPEALGQLCRIQRMNQLLATTSEDLRSATVSSCLLSGEDKIQSIVFKLQVGRWSCSSPLGKINSH